MKKIFSVLSLLSALVLGFSLSACKKDSITVGILQLVTHGALNSAREGFIDALREGGFEEGKNLTLIVKNPEADPTALQAYANELIRDCDLVLGIATDAAYALLNERDNVGKHTPVLFTAVTDPVKANLVLGLNNTANNCTGSSDLSDIQNQIEVIKKIKPNASTLCILYHSSEVNSQSQAQEAKSFAESEGLTVSIKTVNEVSELPSTLVSIASLSFDAVFIPTDNLMAANITTVVDALNEAQILSVVGEEGLVSEGGCISVSINYKELGHKTGDMACRILNGTKVSDIPVLSITTSPDDIPLSTVMNEESLVTIGLDVNLVKAALEG